MTKIAIETDRTLKILLREYFEYEFIETKNYEIDDILKEGIVDLDGITYCLCYVRQVFAARLFYLWLFILLLYVSVGNVK